MATQTRDRADGFQAVNGGVNSGLAPNTIGRNQLAWATNATCRGGFIHNRPGWVKRTLKFWDENKATDTTLRDNFQDNLFQGACAFTERNMLMASIGGRLFRIELRNFTVLDVSDTLPALNTASRRRAWFVEAAGYIVVQDGQSAPIIYDGSVARRADSYGGAGTKEVPVGTVMAFANGRLWVTLPNGRSFVGSDLIYGPTGTPAAGRKDAVLKFTENEFYNGGGAFSIPSGAGVIRAMAPVAQLDTSQGQGPLQVFTDTSIFSVSAPASREAWFSVTYPIQSISFVGSGATSDRAAPNVNGDIWFRSQDGVRSFVVARRDFGSWVNTPLSKEVERVVDKDDRNLLIDTSACLFDNRLLVSVAPYRNWDHGTVFRGLVALDFNPLGLLGASGSRPVWEGSWSGMNILQVLSGVFDGVERCFAFALSDDEEIELWELTRNADFDNDGTQDVPITWSFETGSFNWGEQDGGWNLKKFEYADIWYDELFGSTTFDFDYRPDQDPRWQDIHTWTSCATKENCLTNDPATGCATQAPKTLAKQYRNRMRMPTPANDCNDISGTPYRVGFEFQFRATITGSCRIKKFRAWVSDVQEATVGGCPSDSTCKTLENCPSDLYDYTID